MKPVDQTEFSAIDESTHGNCLSACLGAQKMKHQRGFALPFAVPTWAIYAILTAAVLLFTGWQGYRLGVAKLESYKVEQLEQATKLYLARERVTERVVNHYIQVKGETRTVTETVEKEVIKYADSNPGFTLDGAWRLLHDDAARNVIPAAGFILDGKGGAAPRAAEALNTVTANYAACHRTADRLDALQDWVRQQQAVRLQ